MNLDIATLSYILCILIILQIFVIFVQVKLNKAFHCINFCIWGEIFVATGLFLMFYKSPPLLKLLSIIIPNLFILFGQIFIYIGIVAFLGRKEKRFIISFMMVVFTISLLYFTYIKDNLSLRITNSSISIACISFLTCFELLYHIKPTLRLSSKFLGFLFFFNGIFFTILVFISIQPDKYNSFFNPSRLIGQILLFSIINIYLWSYGLTILLYQNVNAEKRVALERSQLIFDTNPDIVIISSLQNGLIVDVNKKFVTGIGFSKKESINKTTTDLKIWHHAEDRKLFINLLTEYGYCENFELVMERKDGTIIHGLLSATLTDLDGSPHIISVIRNINERKLAEDKIKVLSKAMEQSPASIVITDTFGNIQYVNKKFIDITGYSFEEVLGQNPRILKAGFEPNQTYKELWESVLQGKEWKGEFHNKKKSGELYWESASISPILDDFGSIVQLLAIKEDITERKRLEKELHKHANFDSLTGILNRRCFMSQVEAELDKNQRHPKENAFIMMDIDHFKYVNDNFGHATGDIALAKVATVCKDTLRVSDIFGRIGGEEFSVFLVETDFVEAQKIAERLRINVENIVLYDTHGTKVPLYISIGITNYSKDVDNLQTLMIRSDKALYQAKSEGRNRIVVVSI